MLIDLEPGNVCFTEDSSRITTVLGSCIAVTMWVPRIQIGAICHSYLPECTSQEHCQNLCNNKFKYLNCSILWMIDQITRRDVKRMEIECKIFGGSEMIVSFWTIDNKMSVGKQNSVMALNTIRNEGLTLVSHDMGGRKARKIIFDTSTGVVMLKRINLSLNNNTRYILK